MSAPQARILPDGKRLHLQHGPIDLIIGAEGATGAREAAFAAAQARFEGLLEELVSELPLLRGQLKGEAHGVVARRMQQAVAPHAARTFVTPMAAVAGAVAEAILSAMKAATPLRRAYVNNGGDIAFHLCESAQFSMGIASPEGRALGRISIGEDQKICGLATSGQGGRSLSLGIADAVTVLASTAPMADVAATLIANAVDLPDHTAIRREAAHDVDPDSDLGDRAVVVHVGALAMGEVDAALARGVQVAEDMRARGLISQAALFLRGHSRVVAPKDSFEIQFEEALEDA